MRQPITIAVILLSLAFNQSTLGQTSPRSPLSDDTPTSTVNLNWRAARVCGVNCVYLLLRHFNQAVEYQKLEADLLRDDITSLADLKRAATSRGLATQVLRTDRDGLDRLPRPMIAHLDHVSPQGETSGHFVLILKNEGENGVACIDGTTAEPRTIPWSEFERDWSGHVLATFAPTPSSSAGLLICGTALWLGYYCVNCRRGLLAGAYRVADWAMRRTRLSTGAVFGLACLMGSFAQAVDIPTLETIGRAYQGRDQGIRSIRADYHAEQTLMVDPGAYYQATHNWELMPFDITIVVAADGRRYQSVSRKEHTMTDILEWVRMHRLNVPFDPDPNNLPYPDIANAMRRVTPKPSGEFNLFDGTNLWGHSLSKIKPMGVEHDSYVVRDIPSQNYAYFASTPLDWAGWTFLMPALPKDDQKRRKERIPDMFEVGNYTVSPATERVGADECVVLTAPGKRTLWLLPDKKFAVRKAESLLEGQKVFVAEFTDFKPFGVGAWIAGKTITTSFGVKKSHPAEFEGKALTRITYSLTNLQRDDPASEALLRVDPKAGDFVLDQALVTGPGKGKDSVSYQVPADRQDLDRVINEAVARDLARQPRPWYRSPAPWIVLVVAIAIVVVVVRRTQGK